MQFACLDARAPRLIRIAQAARIPAGFSYAIYITAQVLRQYYRARVNFREIPISHPIRARDVSRRCALAPPSFRAAAPLPPYRAPASFRKRMGTFSNYVQIACAHSTIAQAALTRELRRQFAQNPPRAKATRAQSRAALPPAARAPRFRGVPQGLYPPPPRYCQAKLGLGGHFPQSGGAAREAERRERHARDGVIGLCAAPR